MEKKKIIIVLAIIVLIIVGIVMITSKNGGSSGDALTLTQEEAEYTMSIKVPEDKDNKGTSKYKLVTADSGVELKDEYTQYAVIGDKVQIEFEYTNYVYQTTVKYKAKYGEKDTNFANYKQALLDSEISYINDVEEMNVNGKEAVQYKADKQLMRVLNTDNISKKKLIYINIHPVNENDSIEELVQQEEIKDMIDSIEFKKK